MHEQQQSMVDVGSVLLGAAWSMALCRRAFALACGTALTVKHLCLYSALAAASADPGALAGGHAGGVGHGPGQLRRHDLPVPAGHPQPL